MNQVLRENQLASGKTLQLVEGDITQEKVDVIVNAANEYLRHGGGVAGAILRRGGQQIQAESNAWVREHGPVSHQQPAHTRAGKLPFQYIIHAVGPVWGSGKEDEKLADAVRGTLVVAADLKQESLAIPAISTGIFGFPLDRAARVMFTTIRKYLQDQPESSVCHVRVIVFGGQAASVFQKIWDDLETEHKG